MAYNRVVIDSWLATVLAASEPLPRNTTAQLVSGAETVVLRPMVSNRGEVVGFYKPGVALRYETTYEVIVSPWIDLAGNPGAKLPTLTTDPSPPFLVDPGFESAPTGTSVGGARIIDVNTLPPIEGQKSAFLSSDDLEHILIAPSDSRHMRLRLATKASDRVVRLSLRPISGRQVGGRTDTTQINVAVPGGAVNRAEFPFTETFPTRGSYVIANQVFYLGDVREVEIPLPSGFSSEVYFDFSTENPTPYPRCGSDPAASYLIDNLRVE